MGCDLEHVVLPSDVYFFFPELKKDKSWLLWVFVAVIRLSLVVAHGLPLWWSPGSRAHGLSRCGAHGLLWHTGLVALRHLWP